LSVRFHRQSSATARLEGDIGIVRLPHWMAFRSARLNNGHGLHLMDGGQVLVTGTVLAQNLGYGIFTGGDDGGTSLELHNSTIERNTAAARLPAYTVSPPAYTGSPARKRPASRQR